MGIEPSSGLPSLRHQMTSELMQKMRHGSRKTSDLSKSDCSVYERCRQRYLVYYERYRNEILQGRVRSETESSDEI